MKLKSNCCDGVYNSLDIHFTSVCDNKCAHCIDMQYNGVGVQSPDVDAIVSSIVDECEGVDDVLFLGGEPCLYLDALLDCVTRIRELTDLEIFVTTAVPKICMDQKEKFFKLIELVDGLNISVQHYREDIADQIRQVTSKYDRQKFYNSLPNKEKIRVNINIVKPFLYTKEDITACLYHYDKMGFNSIKLSEIQHGEDVFVSFEDTFDIQLPPPYSDSCQTYLDTSKLLPGVVSTPILLKRSCFMCEESLPATLSDGIKVLFNAFSKPTNKYGVIYGNGQVEKGWI